MDKNLNYFLYPRPEGHDGHSWAQGIMHVQYAKYTLDHLGPDAVLDVVRLDYSAFTS